ncbi:hypothetical protein PoB_004427000 [Plakobranchus ocellatus]|uniref:Uncharacterized protein n=1 Tax=Plakobranchus ocellatus TaxID=259542 RepID=A0AAV4BDX8_9GAST|nr:hypothetical protein PoB_004427000 [Plakobranchus ocellatus]
MAEARCDTVAEAMEAEFSPEATDPIVGNLDMYLSTAATLTEAEALQEHQVKGSLHIYAAVITKDSPKITKPDAKPKVLKALDGHFHLDKIMRKVAKVSENIRMSFRQSPSIQEKMSGRVEVFYDPAKYPNNIF